MSDFLPTRDGDLLTWSVNFNAKINATPTDYGLTAGQATAYTTLHDAFATAFQTASDPLTRSPANIVAKDGAKAALITSARQLAGIIQKYPGTTDFMRSELGLTVKDAEPSPIPPPADAPQLDVVTVSGRTVRIRLRDVANPTRRGKPAGVSGASVFSYVGATPPPDVAAWKFEGNIGVTKVDVTFPTTVEPGAQVWLTAFWFNPRKQSGPACTPVTTYLAGGLSMAA
jgi:hypothetical protein